MEDYKKKVTPEMMDKEIVFSKSVKAGKRIYYLDVKKSKNEDLFVAITESKKKVTGYDEDAQVTYEKHKIFLYKEDFNKFTDGLEDVINFIKREQGIESEKSEKIEGSVINEEVSEKSVEETENSKPKSFFDKFKF